MGQFLLSHRKAASKAALPSKTTQNGNVVALVAAKRSEDRFSWPGKLTPGSSLGSRFEGRLAIEKQPPSSPPTGCRTAGRTRCFSRATDIAALASLFFRRPRVRKMGPPGGPTFSRQPPDTDSSATSGKQSWRIPPLHQLRKHAPSPCTTCSRQSAASHHQAHPNRRYNFAVKSPQARQTPSPSPPSPAGNTSWGS